MTQHFSLSRRDLLKLSACGTIGASMSGWLPLLANGQGRVSSRPRSVILLWMTGGPAQTDTFDMKPGHEHGGPFQPIETSVPGIQICEHLPQVATMMQHCVPIRSMTTTEGDHVRATHLLRTGYSPRAHVEFPTLGSRLGQALRAEESNLPPYVAVAPYTDFCPAAFGPGSLGDRFAPHMIGQPSRPGERSVEPTVREVATSHPDASEAFDLELETATLREAYGRNQFGQGCLLARRLVERGVPFVEVSLSQKGHHDAFAWDTHSQNFAATHNLLSVLDPAWAALMRDLRDRGLLDSTLIVWMGEFGRTPKINAQAGRDHFPAAWTTVLCGAGLKAGQVVGKTSADGMTVEDRPVSAADLHSTIRVAVGLDGAMQLEGTTERLTELAGAPGKPIAEMIA